MHCRFHRKTCALILIFLSFSFPAFAEDCEPLLTPDITVEFTKKNIFAYLDSTMCVKTFDEFSKKYGADTAGNYFGITGKGNFTSDNYEKHQTSNCNTLTKLEIDQSIYFHSTKIIPEQARINYLQCVQAKSLVCMFSKETGAPVVQVYYHSDHPAPTIVDSFPSTKDTNLVVPSETIKKGDKLKKNKTLVVPKIIDPSKAARFVLQVHQDGVGDGCFAYLPAPSALPELPTEEFRISGYVTHSSEFKIKSKVPPYADEYITVYQPRFDLSWPEDNIVGIYDWNLTVEQWVHGKLCASGHLTGTDQNFNEPSAHSDTVRSPEFSGGAEGSIDHKTIKFFLNPKNDCR